MNQADSKPLGNGEPVIQGEDPNKSLVRAKSTISTEGSLSGGQTPAPDPNTETVDSRPTRKKWPRDRAKRLKAMTKAMPEFLMAYYGNETPIASAMSVTPVDVREAIQSNPELVELQEIAVNSVEALLLDHAMYVALNSKNVAGVKWILETKFPERYGKSKATAKKDTGFTAPTDDPEDLEPVFVKK